MNKFKKIFNNSLLYIKRNFYPALNILIFITFPIILFVLPIRWIVTLAITYIFVKNMILKKITKEGMHKFNTYYCNIVNTARTVFYRISDFKNKNRNILNKKMNFESILKAKLISVYTKIVELVLNLKRAHKIYVVLGSPEDYNFINNIKDKNTYFYVAQTKRYEFNTEYLRNTDNGNIIYINAEKIDKSIKNKSISKKFKGILLCLSEKDLLNEIKTPRLLNDLQKITKCLKINLPVNIFIRTQELIEGFHEFNLSNIYHKKYFLFNLSKNMFLKTPLTETVFKEKINFFFRKLQKSIFENIFTLEYPNITSAKKIISFPQNLKKFMDLSFLFIVKLTNVQSPYKILNISSLVIYHKNKNLISNDEINEEKYYATSNFKDFTKKEITNEIILLKDNQHSYNRLNSIIRQPLKIFLFKMLLISGLIILSISYYSSCIYLKKEIKSVHKNIIAIGKKLNPKELQNFQISSKFIVSLNNLLSRKNKFIYQFIIPNYILNQNIKAIKDIYIKSYLIPNIIKKVKYLIFHEKIDHIDMINLFKLYKTLNSEKNISDKEAKEISFVIAKFINFETPQQESLFKTFLIKKLKHKRFNVKKDLEIEKIIKNRITSFNLTETLLSKIEKDLSYKNQRYKQNIEYEENYKIIFKKEFLKKYSHIDAIYRQETFFNILNKSIKTEANYLTKLFAKLTETKKTVAINEIIKKTQKLYIEKYINYWLDIAKKMKINNSPNINRLILTTKFVSEHQNDINLISDKIYSNLTMATETYKKFGYKTNIKIKMKRNSRKINSLIKQLNSEISSISRSKNKITKETFVLLKKSISSDSNKTTVGKLYSECNKSDYITSNIVQEMLSNTIKILSEITLKYINFVWRREILLNYNNYNSVKRNLSIVPYKITFTKFKNTFHPKGQINIFISKYITYLINGSSHSKIPLSLTKSFNSFIKKRKDIQDIFFPSLINYNPIKAYAILKPKMLSPYFKKVSISFGEKNINYSHGPQEYTKVLCYSLNEKGNNIVISFLNQNGIEKTISFSGQWAFFKFLINSKIEKTKIKNKFNIYIKIDGHNLIIECLSTENFVDILRKMTSPIILPLNIVQLIEH